MNTTKITEKRIYISPEVINIKLDNEISLALASSPPEGPSEGALKTSPHFLNADPFKNSLT
jgi:hypothetical protein